jgi:osmotically-inducible protein OsmY
MADLGRWNSDTASRARPRNSAPHKAQALVRRGGLPKDGAAGRGADGPAVRPHLAKLLQIRSSSGGVKMPPRPRTVPSLSIRGGFSNLAAMKRLLFGFLLGVLTGAGGYWYFQEGMRGSSFQETKNQVAHEAEKWTSTVQEKFHDLTSEAVRDELAKTSMVIREKAAQAGHAIMDATANARTTAAIKTKLLAEPGVPGMRINVDTSGGIVTLSGTVSTPDQVARAIRITLDTEGITKVISTIQVKPKE